MVDGWCWHDLATLSEQMHNNKNGRAVITCDVKRPIQDTQTQNFEHTVETVGPRVPKETLHDMNG